MWLSHCAHVSLSDILFENYFIDWLIFGCAGWGGLFSSCDAQASHCGAFSCCGTRPPLLEGMSDLPRPGIKLMSPTLTSAFFTTATTRKPPTSFFIRGTSSVGLGPTLMTSFELNYLYEGWNDWIASPSQRTWTWVHSRRQWETGRSGKLQSIGLERHDLAAEEQPPPLWKSHLQNLFGDKSHFKVLGAKTSVYFLQGTQFHP